MWLLNVRTRKLEYFTTERSVRVPYAILSHTWGKDEVTFQEMKKNQKFCRKKKGYVKIEFTCRQAMEDHLSYCWIDTICIDKSSSTELSESINSMYRWYRSAIVCYAYLVDVSGDCPCLNDWPVSKTGMSREQGWISQFASSRWHTRSWTLQELIAPQVVQFYGEKWNYLGSRGRRFEPGGQWSKKKYLQPLLSYITDIDIHVLEDNTELGTISVARKLSWASQRESTRVEDQAYSLLGIFNINMPLLYGESQNAFIRLQQEIARTSNDLSFLAWLPKVTPSERLLAATPRYFRTVGNVVPVTRLLSRETLDVTYNGLRMNVPVFRKSVDSLNITWIILNCRYADDLSGPMAARITFRDPRLNLPDATFNHSEYYEASLSLYHQSRLEVIDIEECKNARMQCLLLTQDLPRNVDQGNCINAMPEFWFKLPSEPGLEFRIVDTDPDMDWNYETGVFCPRSRDAVETFVTIETPWETLIYFKFKFTSELDFWLRQRAVHTLPWGHQFTLEATHPKIDTTANFTLSLPSDKMRHFSGKLRLTNDDFMKVELDRKEIMGTLVFTIDLIHIKDTSDQPNFESVALSTSTKTRPPLGSRGHDRRSQLDQR